ncbi:redoxin domain-containing protein [Sulfurimonas aquatica]|uniref:Redoxin domain-containing protein n=1 Tax=Sulfurimonas aquatica TaxID=2672570 RepID=A0A975GD18_9BACT|nr:TlpA disulfide reductase family protein [Sulfurimonas aquatica]QSZ42112.1 redoxin domain-containing protein [Sulfurimonas aquatica]
MSKISILSALISLSLLFSSCTKEKEVVEEEANTILSTNEYVLTGLDNKQYVVKKEANGYVVDGAKGKVIILDIFATWCPPCKAEASHLTSLQNKYKDNLLILGLTIEDGIPNEKLQEFRKNYDANYVLVNSSENRRLIESVATELKVGRSFGIPLMAMYKDAKLVNYYQGATEEEFIESDIKKALGK